MRSFLKNLIRTPGYLAAGLIEAYQYLLSPDHSWLAARFPYGYCRHYPTCSEYSRQSFLKFGVVKGVYLSAKRIIKCNPWASPSVDQVKL